MEELGLRALRRRVAGIDVHRMLHVVLDDKGLKLGGVVSDTNVCVQPRAPVPRGTSAATQGWTSLETA